MAGIIADVNDLNPLFAAISFSVRTFAVPERCQSGRMYLIRNQMYRKVPGVRIPPFPLLCTLAHIKSGGCTLERKVTLA